MSFRDHVDRFVRDQLVLHDALQELHKQGTRLAAWQQDELAHSAPHVARTVEERMRAFAAMAIRAEDVLAGAEQTNLTSGRLLRKVNRRLP